MGCALSSTFICIFFIFSLSFPIEAFAKTQEAFLQCLSQIASDHTNIYTPNSPSYSSVLNFSAQNPRFSSPSSPKPLAIVAPARVSGVQKAVKCARKHSVQIRVRSGGHDYEGLSYVSRVPFAIIDLINLRSINVEAEKKTAWLQAGATLGELYYRVAEKSGNLGFPAGTCHTIGVGGHFSGGGYGTMLRKYGLAADQIVDAQIVNVEGQLLDRKSMGEDLFWAIRGGGGASFGVIVAWKVKLVPVPSIVTVFTVGRSLEQNATKLVHRWQYIADKFHEDLFIRLILQTTIAPDGTKAIQVLFNSLFLGGIDRLLPLMRRSFPELGLVREDCTEMSWIDSTVYFNWFPRGQSLDVLLQRASPSRSSFKAKSDFVKEPIPEKVLEGIWERLYEEEVGAMLIMSPFGGKMSEISESETPFPHRAGNICLIQYLLNWEEKGNVTESQKHISWVRRVYSYMTPYVSKNPREAYLNYRDLDIGTNGDVTSNCTTRNCKPSNDWGRMYFKNNFDKLIQVKKRVDPTNFFRNEQSIPVAP